MIYLMIIKRIIFSPLALVEKVQEYAFLFLTGISFVRNGFSRAITN